MSTCDGRPAGGKGAGRVGRGAHEEQGVQDEWERVGKRRCNGVHRCVFGISCRHGLRCCFRHDEFEKEHFARRDVLREAEWVEQCGYCRMGCCRHGQECARSRRSVKRTRQDDSEYSALPISARNSNVWSTVCWSRQSVTTSSPQVSFSNKSKGK